MFEVIMLQPAKQNDVYASGIKALAVILVSSDWVICTLGNKACVCTSLGSLHPAFTLFTGSWKDSSVRLYVCVSKLLFCCRANKRCRLQLLGYRRCRGEIWPCLDVQDQHANRKETACRAVLPPSVNGHTHVLFCLFVLFFHVIPFIGFSR